MLPAVVRHRVAPPPSSVEAVQDHRSQGAPLRPHERRSGRAVDRVASRPRSLGSRSDSAATGLPERVTPPRTRRPPGSRPDELPPGTDRRDPPPYLLRALVTENAPPAMTISTTAMIQKGGESCPAPLAKSCLCDTSFPTHPQRLSSAVGRAPDARLPRGSVRLRPRTVRFHRRGTAGPAHHQDPWPAPVRRPHGSFLRVDAHLRVRQGFSTGVRRRGRGRTRTGSAQPAPIRHVRAGPSARTRYRRFAEHDDAPRPALPGPTDLRVGLREALREGPVGNRCLAPASCSPPRPEGHSLARARAAMPSGFEERAT